MLNETLNGINLFHVTSIVIVTTLLAAIIAFPLINFLYKFKLVRNLDVDFSALIESRKSKSGTPIMGGLIFIIPIAFISIFANLNSFTKVPLVIFLGMALLGGTDDVLNIYGRARKIRSVRRVIKLIKVHKSKLTRIKLLFMLPWLIYSRFVHMFESNPGKGLFGHERLIIQLMLGFLLGIWLFNSTVLGATTLWVPVIGSIKIGILIIPLAIFAMLTMTNAVNFSDGLDGLSSGMLIIAYSAFFCIAVLKGNAQIALLTGTVIGGLITYLYFNIPPARVQMGDVGSFSLGGLLTAVGFALNVPMLLPIIGFPFVVEVSSTILQSLSRKLFGRRLLNMAPLHHHFEMIGWSEEKVVMRFWLFALVCAVAGVWLSFV